MALALGLLSGVSDSTLTGVVETGKAKPVHEHRLLQAGYRASDRTGRTETTCRHPLTQCPFSFCPPSGPPSIHSYFMLLENHNSSSYFPGTWIFSCSVVLFFSENIFWEGNLSVGFSFFPFLSFKLNIIICSMPESVCSILHVVSHLIFHWTLKAPFASHLYYSHSCWKTEKLNFGKDE